MRHPGNACTEDKYIVGNMSPVIERPVLAGDYPGLVMAQSTRYGGASAGPYASLNLGLNTGDDKETVAENRRRFWQALGTAETEIAGGYQVHGCEIKVVETPGCYDGYDAFVTDRPGIFLSVTVADCVPVLVYDPVQKVAAAVHAGWRGTVQEITAKTISRIREAYGTSPSDCIAYIGTCIGYDSFEVSEEVAGEFAPDLKKPAAIPGKYLVDLKGANKKQLLAAGLKEGAVEVSPCCTLADHARFFSYRKEGGVTGRMLAAIGMTL